MEANQIRFQNRILFVISLYASTNSGEDTAKEMFYDELNCLLSMRHLSNGNFNLQLGQLSTCGLSLGGL